MAGQLHQACALDIDCGYLQECLRSHCVHKTLFPVSAYEALAALCVLVTSATSYTAEASSLSLMPPILTFISGFTTHQSIPISHLAYSGGLFLPLLCSLRFDRRIDRVTTALSLPLLLVGVFCGVSVNAAVPDWALLGVVTVVMASEGISQSRRLLTFRGREHKDRSAAFRTALIPQDLSHSPETEREMSTTRSRFYTVAWIVVIMAMATAVLRGGKGAVVLTGIEECKGVYWAITAGFAGVCLVVSAVTAKVAVGNSRTGDTVQWTYGKSTRLQCFSFLAGFLSSLIGITGCILLYPILKYSGSHSVPSTASFLAFLSTALSFTLYAVAGMVSTSYSIWYALWSFIGSALSVYIRNRLGTSYSLYTTLSLLFALSTVLFPVYATLHIKEMMADGAFRQSPIRFC